MLAAANPRRRRPSAAVSGGSGAAAPDYRTKPFAGEAERSGKQGPCAAFNEALPVQQRLETLHKVCALAFAFSAAHIQRAPLHSAQRCTARSAAQRAALHSAPRYTARRATAQRFTAPSASLRSALHCAKRFTAQSVALRKALHSAQHCTPPPLQRCTARSITQRPALHCTEHSEPRQGRSQQANQAGCAKGVCCAFFVRFAPLKT